MKFLFLLLACLTFNLTSAQVSKDTLNKPNKTNALMFNFGIAVPAIQLSAQLEHQVFKKKVIRGHVRYLLGIYSFGDFDGGGETSGLASAGFAFLLGKEKHFLDIYLGGTYMSFEKNNLNGFNPAVGLSYRLKTGSGYMLNAGVGFPHLVFFSSGFAF